MWLFVIAILVIVRALILIYACFVYTSLIKIYEDKEFCLKVPYSVYSKLVIRQLAPSQLLLMMTTFFMVRDRRILKSYMSKAIDLESEVNEFNTHYLCLISKL